QDQHASSIYLIAQGPNPTYCSSLPVSPPPTGTPCGSTSRDTADAHQHVRQVGVGQHATSGHQSQNSEMTGQSVQCSDQPAHWVATTGEVQKLRAKSSGVIQSQLGPIRCCDKVHLGQAASTAATCSFGQQASQSVLPHVAAPAQLEDVGLSITS